MYDGGRRRYPALMKIAVISDIHGNIAALDAVLADIAAHGVARIVNLGDILSGPLFPVETAERLMALDLPTIRGNHERQLLAPDRARMIPSDRYAAEALSSRHLDWIARLPETMAYADDVLMVHGTPASDVRYFLQTVTPEGLRDATADELEARGAGVTASLILCGHTHLPGTAWLSGERLIVNPGSVGLPAYADDLPFPHRIETGTPDARYAIVARVGDGWRCELRAIPYDAEPAARRAGSNGRPDWAVALRTGFV